MVAARVFLQIRKLNSLSASVTRPHRLYYLRTYPTKIVNSDGSTYTIRYHEPRQIIKLPIDIWALSEESRKSMISKRKPKQKVVIEEHEEDNYDSNKYLKYLKK